MNARTQSAPLARTTDTALALALLLAPWAGVGVVHLFTGRVLGTGVQPAFVPLLLVVALFAWRCVRGHCAGAVTWPWILVLVWTLLTTANTWTLDHMGLAGEAAFAKSLKQFVVLAFFGVVFLAVRERALAAGPGPWKTWERAASLGLVIALVVAVVQALGFAIGLPGAEALGRVTSSNPSIAAGSEELYLGHRFVGIPRLRGPMPEPLLFGSYLLAVAPITAAGAVAHRGWSRSWRVVVVLAATLALLGTFSRGAWLGAAVTVVLLVVGSARGILPRPRGTTAWTVGAIGLTGIAVGAMLLTGRAPWELPGLLAARLSQSAADHDMSNLTRFWAWEAAWRMFLAHPMTGAGWGSFGFHFHAFAPAGAEGAHFGWPVANNLPLMVLAETGAVGLVLWSIALAPALRVRRGREGSPLAHVLAAALIGVLVQGVTFSQWNLPHLWLLLAFAAATGNGGNQVVRELQVPDDGRGGAPVASGRPHEDLPIGPGCSTLLRS